MSDQAIAEVGQFTRPEDDNEAAADHDWQQYVTFLVDGRSYAIEITKIREIRGWSKPTTLPNAPHAMRGLLNLRGIVVPVFDLHCQFSGIDTEVGDSHVVIIVALVDRLIGILVDAVSDILALEPGDIMLVPKADNGPDQAFLIGLVAKGERMISLLELEGLFDIDA
ncbi:MAG: chemotaxis protein CheW [Alphaproteobacteria bacterium]|nr:chemotaxis protein CheW [Alphaproteobacteria bacterium]